MRRWLRHRWLWMVFIAALLPVFAWLFLRYHMVNEMYPALDKLATLSLSERWSHPEMVRIRQLGPAAVPPLRRVLREKDAPATRFLLWVKTKWSGITKHYRYMPDMKKMTERRWTACQVLQTLGPAGKAAVPELIQVMESKDPGDVNAGILELFCEKSERIFIRMLLLPAMMKLGLTCEKCMDVCQTGLRQEEGYYRIQAAELLVSVAEKFPTSEINVDELIRDKDLSVRVYAARIHWERNRRAEAVFPVLIDGLDRKKHQSYYYEQILNTALTTLGDMGNEARAARSAVAILTQDPNPSIAKLASDTLGKLGK